MKTHKRLRQRSVQRGTIITGVALFVMLVMSLSPLLSLTPTASADPFNVACGADQVWSESQQKCVPKINVSGGPILVDPVTPTPDIPIIPDVIDVEPTETAVIDIPEDVDPEVTVEIDEDTPVLVPTETMEPADEGGVTILINKLLCPVGYDPSTADAYDRAVTCDGTMDGVTFNISDGASNIASQMTNQYQPHVAYFQNLPVGPLSVVEVVPAGYEAPFVMCDEHAEGAPIDNMSVEQVLDGNQIFHLFQQPGQVLYCDWFNVPSADATPAAEGDNTIIINKHGCPLGYDASAADIYDLAANCQESQDGVTFNVSDGASNIASQVTGDVLPNMVQFEDMPVGPLSIVEQVPAGYGAPLVFCDEFAVGGNPQNISQEQVLDGNQVFHLFQQSGQVLYCDWFNVPTADYGDNTIIINKHGCPVGYDASAADIYDLAANCQESQDGVTFLVSDGASSIASQATGDVLPSMVQFENMPEGPLSIVEQVPAGYGAPLVFCDEYAFGDNPQNISQEQVLDGNQIFHLFNQSDLVLYCDWFNVPTNDTDTASLIIYKHGCPDGYQASADLYDLTLNCQEPQNGIGFIVSDGAQAIASQTTGDVIDSGISIDGLPAGPASIVEQVPAGYQAPYVFCGSYSDANPDPAINQESVLDGNQIFHIFEPGETLICDWFNVPVGEPTDAYGDVTIYKYTCPAGYNYNALGADPVSDCPYSTNGVTFTLDGPNGYHTQTNTGDSVNGAVYFGGLEPGSYQANELLPDGIADAFVWNCTGGSIGMVQDHPISTGTSLDIPVAYGDQIVCNWYNVPAYDPEVGQIHLVKYACVGTVYTSAVNCEIYEGGAKFDLLTWNGSQWVVLPNYSGQTNVYGELSWTSLAPSSYQIDEINGEPCYITADHQDGQGNISVLDGQVTTIKVYNCGYTTGDPVKPGKPTTKYPNTGVAPVAPESTSVAQNATEGEAPLAGFEAVEDLCKKDEKATPEPDATPEPECDRGAVPVSVEIEAIEVDANIEVLETVNGAMQAPSDEKFVAWYKETARLGENGNLVLAGHLNWWGFPQAVFFAINTLQEGDIITITGDDGEVYEYEVQWVQQLDAFASPDEAVASTEEESLTLITCGGEWDSSASEYNQRTVVRAVRINAD